MSSVFAVAGYWIAFFNSKDDLHKAALIAAKRIADRPIITSENVLVEFLNEFSASGSHVRSLAGMFVTRLRESGGVIIEPQTTDGFAEALDLYINRPDKEWSLTDCESINICSREGITEVLAHDHHFEQAGLKALLREDSEQ